MKPAASIILFTTMSGAGFGLLALVCLFAAAGVIPTEPIIGSAAFGLAFVLITGGLASSTFHLGHPERAWRALSQWRSSWLSREGVAALSAYPPSILCGWQWIVHGEFDGLGSAAAIVAAGFALGTIYCTAMIYASLKPVPQWRSPWTVWAYLTLGLMTGMIFLDIVLAVFGDPRLWHHLIALSLVGAAWITKAGYWSAADTKRPLGGTGDATGLGGLGRVRALDPPHTGENYLLREMAFRVGRKHARFLRRLVVGVGFVVPIIALLAAVIADGVTEIVGLVAAAVGASVGVLLERWLFFAEATHTVVLYYGRGEPDESLQSKG